MNKEIKSLTGLRGVASLYVVIFHFYQYLELHISKNHDFEINKLFTPLFIHGYLAVDVFFVLSAFVITLSSKKYFDSNFKWNNYKTFMQKRWIRIYPAYIIVAIYGYVVVENFGRTPNFILSLTLLNLVFGLSHILGHLWSLGAEWITYLLYPFFYKLSKITEAKYWKYVLIICGTILLYIVGVVWNKKPFSDYMLEIFQGYPSLFRCFADYLIGMGAYLIYKENNFHVLTSRLWSIILGILLIVALCLPKGDLIIVLISAAIILNVSKDDSLIARILASRVVYFLGIISYPLYLINSLVYLKFSFIEDTLHNYFNISHPGIIGVTFIGTCITIATIFTFYIEAPIISFLTKRIKSN